MVGVEELKKDRDQRLKLLRDEIEQITEKYEKLQSDHSNLTVQHRGLDDEYVRLKDDYRDQTKTLQTANDVCQNMEIQLNEITKQYRFMKDSYGEKEVLMNDYKRKFEDEMRKLNEAERKADVLEIEKKSVEKQNEIQRK